LGTTTVPASTQSADFCMGALPLWVEIRNESASKLAAIVWLGAVLPNGVTTMEKRVALPLAYS
jgi:hypothetical protein